MPPLTRNYQPLPYAPQPRYVPNYGTLGELMGIRARNSQQGWAQLAHAFNTFVENRNQAEVAKAALAQRESAQQAEQALKREEMAARDAERKEAARLRQEAADEKQQLATEKRGDARAKAIGYGPIAESDVDTLMQSPERSGDVRYVFGPGTAQGPELQPTQEQQEMIGLREAVAKQGGVVGPNGGVHMPPKPTERRPQPAMVNGRRAFVLFGEDGTATDLAGRPVNATPIGPDGPAPEKPSVWVSKGSDMRFVTPSQAAQLSAEGWRSGQSREQGRPVTSGDAGEVADYDTALDDIRVVRGVLSGSKATGTGAAIGAAMPAFITDTLGWGTEAKQKQATIDRVKQVIGKALEGGVLRKEDELKYAKILPVISDTPEIVATKLQGLEDAIAQRRTRKLDALGDAGYDVSQFMKRGQVTDQRVNAVPDLAGVREGFSRTYRSGPFAGQEWAIVNGQPKRIK